MKMVIKTNTEPAAEPLTLAEVKLHLRLDSGTVADNITSSQSIAPGSHAVAASYSLKGTGIDVLGYTALVQLVSGTNGAGGTVDVTIQEADTDSDASYTDWTGGAFTQVTTSNDNATYEKAYTGTKRYIRGVATVANQACEFGVDVIKYAATAAEDSWLTNAIIVARQGAEQVLNRALITQTISYYLSGWPKEDYIGIPRPPLIALTSTVGITYTGADSVVNTWSTTYYNVDTNSDPGRVWLEYGQSYPSESLHPVNPIRIQYTAGYGTAGTSVPYRIRQGMLQHVANMYANRGDVVVSTDDIPPASLKLYQSYRNFFF